jgi:hypothetical protein
MYIPLYEDRGGQQNLRYEYGSSGASFPSYMKRKETVKPLQNKASQSVENGKQKKQ